MSLGVGGCSLSGPLDTLFGSDRTASITPPPGTKEAAQLPPDADLAYARAAASAVLSRGEKDTSMPWENPRTGTRGTVTADCHGIHPGRTNLPGFSGELRERQFAILVAG